MNKLLGYHLYYKIILQCLSRALTNENPKLLMAASAAFLPVNPLVVSVIHTGMMEVNCFSIFLNDNSVFIFFERDNSVFITDQVK